MKIASSETLARLLGARLADAGDPHRTVTLTEFVEAVMPYAYVRAALSLAGKGEYDLAILELLRRRDLIQADPPLVEAVETELGTPEPSLAFVPRFSDSILRLRPGALERVAESETSSVAGEADAADEADEEAEREPIEASGETSGAAEADGRTAEADEDAPDDDADPEPSPAQKILLERFKSVAPPPAASDPPQPEPETPPKLELVSEGEPSDAVPPSTPERAREEEPWAPIDAAAPTCWSCSARLPDRESVRFCPNCGASQEQRRCHDCDEVVEDDWRFCAGCGAPQGPK